MCHCTSENLEILRCAIAHHSSVLRTAPESRKSRSASLLPRHQRTEELPGLAFETLHLQLLERRKIRRAGLDLRARQIDADLEVEVGGLAHHVLAGEIVAALPEHLLQTLGDAIAEDGRC